MLCSKIHQSLAESLFLEHIRDNSHNLGKMPNAELWGGEVRAVLHQRIVVRF